jgi:hypothetical protein
MSKIAMLKCRDCGHENEPERVYCHECGAKLDRSLMPKTEDGSSEGMKRNRRRVKRAVDPNKGRLAQTFSAIGKALVFSALLASVYLIAQPPVTLPKLSNEVATQDPKAMWQALLRTDRAQQYPFMEDLINSGLSRMKFTSMPAPFVKNERIFVRLTGPDLQPGKPDSADGRLALTIVRSAFGYPLYFSGIYAVKKTDGRATLDKVGASWGRLQFSGPFTPIGSLMLQGLEKTFADVTDHTGGRVEDMLIQDGQITVWLRPLR